MAPLPCTLSDWAALGIVGQVHYGQRVKALPYRRVIERKTAQAQMLIRQFDEVTKGRGYVSMSFGKDSLVVWHLAQHMASIPAVWINQGPLAEWPDCLALKDILTAQYGMVLHELTPDCTLYDWYKRHGIPTSAAMDSMEDKALNEALMYAPLRRFQQAGAWHGTIWGLRGVQEVYREGRHREILLQSRGLLYQRKMDQQWICSPVGRWTTQHVWAYIDLHALPYPAMYDIDRASIRNGPPLGTSARHFGRVENLHRYFPVIYRHILQEFPAFTAHDLL